MSGSTKEETMRIYQSTVEMIREVERDLFEMGVRYQSATVQDQQVGRDPRFMTIELTGYAYTLTGYDDADRAVLYMQNSLDWARAEASERLVGEVVPPNPGSAWREDRGRWEKFVRDGAFSYSYAERWQYQLPYIIRELRNRPSTRQAVMTMYDVHQDMMNWGGRDRVPCSLSYQFVIRDGVLTLVYNQRSCDFVKFFSTDVYITCELLKHMARETKTLPGRLIHFLGSLHAFAGDLEGKKIF